MVQFATRHAIQGIFIYNADVEQFANYARTTIKHSTLGVCTLIITTKYNTSVETLVQLAIFSLCHFLF